MQHGLADPAGLVDQLNQRLVAAARADGVRGFRVTTVPPPRPRLVSTSPASRSTAVCWLMDAALTPTRRASSEVVRPSPIDSSTAVRVMPISAATGAFAWPAESVRLCSTG